MGGNSSLVSSYSGTGSRTVSVPKITTEAETDFSSHARYTTTSAIDHFTNPTSRPSSIFTLTTSSVVPTATSHKLKHGSTSIPKKAKSLTTLSKSIQPVHSARVSTSKKAPSAVSTSQASVPSASATTATATSTSGVSASNTSLLKTLTEHHSFSTPATTNEAIVSTIKSATPEALVPVATPSQAIIIYRRDLCTETPLNSECLSRAFEYDIAPGQSVETCELEANYLAPSYTEVYPQYEAGVTTNYPMDIGPFSPHGLINCWYISTYQVAGNLVCHDGFFMAPCSVSTATAQGCALATDIPVACAES